MRRSSFSPEAQRALVEARSLTLAAGLELRRCALRPLRLTLEGTGRPVAFDAQGRKVLEVATWHGRRERRPARPADLLRGVLCDGRDPVGAALAELAGGRLRDLFVALFEGRRPAA